MKKCPLCGAKPKHVRTPDPSQGHVCDKCGQSWSCDHDDCPERWWAAGGAKSSY